MPGVTDIVEMGPADAPPPAEIAYPVGPSQLERIVRLAGIPTALGVAALVLATATLILVEPANEIADTTLIGGGSGGELSELRWASGIKLGIAVIALVLAITAVVRLLGRRPRVRLSVNEPEADDPASLDQIEAAVVAAQPQPSTGESTIVGAALVVSVVSFALNAAALSYTLATHVPSSQSTPFGF